MVNTTIGVMNKAKDHTVTQKITRIKRMYGRNIIILDYENENLSRGLEVIIRTLDDIFTMCQMIMVKLIRYLLKKK